MRPRLGLVLAGGVLGALLGIAVGGGVVFGRPMAEDLLRDDGSVSIAAVHGARVAGYAARLFGLPGAAGGAVAALVAFRDRRRRTSGRRPRVAGPALAGLLAAVLVAPAAVGLHAAAILGPAGVTADAATRRLLLENAILSGAAGLLAGVLLARLAARRDRPRPLG